MDTNHAEFEAFEARFLALAEGAERVEGEAKPALDKTQAFLCLYGDNGLSVEEEFAILSQFEANLEALEKIEVETGYWQDTVLFLR
jgi:hypothetical protein